MFRPKHKYSTVGCEGWRIFGHRSNGSESESGAVAVAVRDGGVPCLCRRDIFVTGGVGGWGEKGALVGWRNGTEVCNPM